MNDRSASNSHTLKSYAKLPLILLIIYAVLCLLSLLAPKAGRLNWLMEVAPALIGIMVLFVTYKKFPMSRLIYWGVFIHALILLYGGHYTYAETPLGNWAKELFHLSRNHYDRVGHLALGFFPALIIREVLLRKTPLRRDGWFTFIILSVILAIGAFWELLEWWTTLLVASDVGTAFLGTQGDIWDAQWDMFLAIVGAAISLLLLSKRHDRSMKLVPT
ncbi:MAG: DUF2238 domain-containing protein [Deltaproteobacteria bacterium]|nr:DUF2238 domain-containing protein [Deltaproteobacteria bacterium]